MKVPCECDPQALLLLFLFSLHSWYAVWCVEASSFAWDKRSNTTVEVCGGRRSRKNRITVLSPSLCIFLQYLQAATRALTRRIRVHGLSTQASERTYVCVCIGVPHILDYLFSFYSDLRFAIDCVDVIPNTAAVHLPRSSLDSCQNSEF